MKLYGITGKMQSGKDTFYQFVSAVRPCVRLAFGDGVKEECADACASVWPAVQYFFPFT
jgi:hypothetical protein